MQKYHASEKNVQKMSRDGLRQENLVSREAKYISRREQDSFVAESTPLDHILHNLEEESKQPDGKKRMTQGASGAGRTWGFQNHTLTYAMMTEIPENRKAEYNRLLQQMSNGEISMHELEGRLSILLGEIRTEKAAARNNLVQKVFQKNQNEEEHRKDSKGKAAKEKARKGRLSFDDEESGMVSGKGVRIGKKVGGAALVAASTAVHRKVQEAGEDNSAVEAVEKTEQSAELETHYAKHRHR